ncbi:unnamed protein product [Echinostoma caproni]|uniref:SH3 domain-containing protein n=1 Tax=Echinostoma caproni TaxID=27848 RepID=A0A183ART8_9TREM|nr:unnamed protein product [Echinostoma caproni]
MRMVIALYDYDPATMSPNPDAIKEELPFREGQVIKIFGGCDEDGFYLGECNGLRGLVPSNMVSHPDRELPTSTHASVSGGAISVGGRLQSRAPDGKLDNERLPLRPDGVGNVLPPGQVTKPRRDGDLANVPQRSHNVPIGSAGPGMGPQTGTAYAPGTRSAVHPYGRTISSEGPDSGSNQIKRIPSVSDGTVMNREYMDSGGPSMGYGKPMSPSGQGSYRSGPVGVGQSRSGTVPPDQTAGPFPTADRPNRAQSVRSMVAIYDYDPHVLSPNADAEMELSFRTGDHITVYGEMDEDGFYAGETADGRRGLVPSNFLRELPSGSGPIPSSTNSSRPLLMRDQRTRGSQNSIARVTKPYEDRGYKTGRVSPQAPSIPSEPNPQQMERGFGYDAPSRMPPQARGGAPVPATRRPDDPYGIGPNSERTPRNANTGPYSAQAGCSPPTSSRFASMDSQHQSVPRDSAEHPGGYPDRYAAQWSRDNGMDDSDLPGFPPEMNDGHQNKRIPSAYAGYRGAQTIDKGLPSDSAYPSEEAPGSNQRRRSTIRGLFK